MDNLAYREKYGSWAGNPQGLPPDFTRCCEQIRGEGRLLPHYYQCTRPRGHGPGEAYCKQHDPAKVKAKADAQTAKWAAEARVRDLKWETEKLGRNAIAVLREIAAGHNDARGLASETLREFDEKWPKP